MELALLTGVKVMLSIYDEVDTKLIQYKSDTIEAITEICKKRIDNQESYTNDDVSFLIINNYHISVLQSFRE